MGLIIGTIEPHEQVRQFGYLELNNTRAVQPSTLAFVGLDDFHAVGSDGSIYQMIDKNDFENCEMCILDYVGEDDETYFHYAEDALDTSDDDSVEIYSHCLMIAQQMMLNR